MARPAPLLPQDRRGVARVDDRRVISGIVHVLRSGCRWVDAPPALRATQNALQPVCPLGGQGRLGARFLGTGGSQRPTCQHPARQFGDEGTPLRWGRKRGERNQAIGISRGGRTTKLHALTDEHGRPRAFAHRRPGCRLPSRRSAARPGAARRPLAGRSRLRHRRREGRGEQRRCHAEYSAQNKPSLQAAIQLGSLSRPQRDRTHVRQAQGLTTHRNALRQTRNQLPCRRPPHSGSVLLVMSPEPNVKQ